jgi:hypothetical protein
VLVARGNTALSSPVVVKSSNEHRNGMKHRPQDARAFGRLIAIKQNSRYFTSSVEMSKGILTEVPTTGDEVQRDLQPEVQTVHEATYICCSKELAMSTESLEMKGVIR